MISSSLIKTYFARSGVIGVFIDILLVTVVAIALLGWLDSHKPRELVSSTQTVLHVGKVELVKPWKTSPYVVLTDSSKQQWRFSCYGPYKREYWCGSVDFDGFAGKNDIELSSFDDLVYEIRVGGTPLLTFDSQLQRFRAAVSEGPSILGLMFALIVLGIQILWIRARLK
jgi:hypothetical protein